MTCLASVILLVVFGIVQTFPLTCNNSTQFDCQTPSDPQRCIPLEWLCDGLKDCKNGLDEFHCSYLHTCPEGDFICRSGDCVSSHFKCDGEIDCPGGEDERGCEFLSAFVPSASIPTTCPDHMFQCRHGPCIARAYLCDGEADCPLGEDERNCSRSDENPTTRNGPAGCDPGMVMCADRTACFPKHWICDGEPDCLDGSDESDCAMSMENFLAETITELCHPGEHRCGGGSKCIPVNRTCDGTLDCPNGDDEGPLCNECEKDECSTPEGKQCQHYCEDRHASYRCTCAPGYQLGTDGHSCHLDRDNEGTLMIALGHEVRTMPLFESRTSHEGYETAQSLGSHGIVRSIDFSFNRQLIYLAISGSDQHGEVAVSVGGLLRVIRENIVGVGQVAVDWMGSNFFLTQRYPSPTPGISVCSQNGFFCRRIIKGREADMNDHSKRQHYHGIALHPERGAMVWIESYANHNRIMSANMDGTNVRVLVENKLEYPTGISIDLVTSNVYFGDVEREMIERVNLDTRERTVVLTQGVHHPYDLKYFNGFLYWSDWASSSLKVAELSIHHSSPHLIHSFTNLPFGIAINHSMYQPTPSSFPCLSSDCQWMCVSIPNAEGQLQARCLCPDGYLTQPDGDCVPLRGSGLDGDEASTDAGGSRTVTLDLSHVGVAWMKERCENGDGCLNGGECHDVKNEHGRVAKIVCRCVAPYEGDRCERKNLLEAYTNQLSPSSRPLWFTLFFISFFVLFIIVAFLLSYRYIEQISKASKTVTAMVERRVEQIPPTLPQLRPLLSSMKSRLNATLAGARNLPKKGSGVLRKEFSNPLFNDDRSSTGSATEEQPTNELGYCNPLFADETVNAGPFSGIQVIYTNKLVENP
ncbi:Low-density lipoprotein receptor domain class A [Trichostrongylus colubriformis]|uniref:Low-density lipoprotein receptor domain class A n=1 Tax=Trichostrongylus colubriformis TaxID=6319 RepID=A0AAN8FS49_TRICO